MTSELSHPKTRTPTNLFPPFLTTSQQGIQCDFDDGFCPAWRNVLLAVHNIALASRGELSYTDAVRVNPVQSNTSPPTNTPPKKQSTTTQRHHRPYDQSINQSNTQATGRTVRVKPPGETGVMMLRPRAWCMTEFHLHVNGRAVPGPLVDFGCVRGRARGRVSMCVFVCVCVMCGRAWTGRLQTFENSDSSVRSHSPFFKPPPPSLLIYHCGKELQARGTGPFFYCSKVENYLEARLWNAIFTWAEARLGLARVRGVGGWVGNFSMDEHRCACSCVCGCRWGSPMMLTPKNTKPHTHPPTHPPSLERRTASRPAC